MEKHQSNKLNSYKSVKGVLDDYQDPNVNEAAIRRSVKDFYMMLGEIDRVGTRTIKDTTGETAAKKLAKEKMARLASTMASSGKAYGCPDGRSCGKKSPILPGYWKKIPIFVL